MSLTAQSITRTVGRLYRNVARQRLAVQETMDEIQAFTGNRPVGEETDAIDKAIVSRLTMKLKRQTDNLQATERQLAHAKTLQAGDVDQYSLDEPKKIKK